MDQNSVHESLEGDFLNDEEKLRLRQKADEQAKEYAEWEASLDEALKKLFPGP